MQKLRTTEEEIRFLLDPAPLAQWSLADSAAGIPSRRFFVLGPFRNPLMQASGAPDGTSSRTGRICSDRFRMFPCAIRTIHCHSQSIACWPFLSRDRQPHLPNSSFQRLRSLLTWRLVYDLAGCGKSLNRDDSPPQGLKPSLVLHDLRGAKAPLYHSAAGFRDFFRSLVENRTRQPGLKITRRIA